jgi:hypothetical protein
MGLAILVNKNGNIRSINDVDKPGRNVAVKKGTTGNIYAIQHFKNVKLLVLNDEKRVLSKWRQGRLFYLRSVFSLSNLEKYPDTTQAILQPFQQEQWAMGIQKGNDDLRQQINGFIKHFKKPWDSTNRGRCTSPENKKAFQELGYHFIFESFHVMPDKESESTGKILFGGLLTLLVRRRVLSADCLRSCPGGGSADREISRIFVTVQDSSLLSNLYIEDSSSTASGEHKATVGTR